MKKKKKDNLTKEIMIMLLLTVIILLIMIVALYDFKPKKTLIPELVAYSSDAKTTTIKQEINYTNGGDITADGNLESVVDSLKSYSIDAADLNLYGEKKLYNRGNSNPFEYVQDQNKSANTEGDSSKTSDNNNGGTSTGSGSTTSNGSGQTTSATPAEKNNQKSGDTTTGTFFESKTSK